MSDSKLFRFYISLEGLVLILTVVGIAIPIQNVVWAAPIKCESLTAPTHCPGTGGDDLIVGGGNNNIIDGGAGNDDINAGAGDDDVCGGTGNDKISGAAGNDRLLGDSNLCKLQVPNGAVPGAETINGGPGNDILVHGDAWYSYSDGKKDTLDCGPGDDTASLNITIDHDEAVNCEHINPPGYQ